MVQKLVHQPYNNICESPAIFFLQITEGLTISRVFFIMKVTMFQSFMCDIDHINKAPNQLRLLKDREFSAMLLTQNELIGKS